MYIPKYKCYADYSMRTVYTRAYIARQKTICFAFLMEHIACIAVCKCTSLAYSAWQGNKLDVQVIRVIGS